MIMWMLLMAVLVVLAVLGLLYLASHIRKFGYFKRLTEQKKKTGILMSLLVLAAASALIWIAWGLMNLRYRFYDPLSGKWMVSGSPCMEDDLHHSDRKECRKFTCSSVLRFSCGNHVPWGRICKTYEGNRSPESGCSLDRGRFCR